MAPVLGDDGPLHPSRSLTRVPLGLHTVAPESRARLTSAVNQELDSARGQVMGWRGVVTEADVAASYDQLIAGPPNRGLAALRACLLENRPVVEVSRELGVTSSRTRQLEKQGLRELAGLAVRHHPEALVRTAVAADPDATRALFGLPEAARPVLAEMLWSAVARLEIRDQLVVADLVAAHVAGARADRQSSAVSADQQAGRSMARVRDDCLTQLGELHIGYALSGGRPTQRQDGPTDLPAGAGVVIGRYVAAHMPPTVSALIRWRLDNGGDLPLQKREADALRMLRTCISAAEVSAGPRDFDELAGRLQALPSGSAMTPLVGEQAVRIRVIIERLLDHHPQRWIGAMAARLCDGLSRDQARQALPAYPQGNDDLAAAGALGRQLAPSALLAEVDWRSVLPGLARHTETRGTTRAGASFEESLLLEALHAPLRGMARTNDTFDAWRGQRVRQERFNASLDEGPTG